VDIPTLFIQLKPSFILLALYSKESVFNVYNIYKQNFIFLQSLKDKKLLLVLTLHLLDKPNLSNIYPIKGHSPDFIPESNFIYKAFYIKLRFIENLNLNIYYIFYSIFR